jgi:hypothetical protein
MATETAAATLAAEGASAGLGAASAAGAAIKAFVLSNPVSLAGVAGLVVGVVGYHFLFDHGGSDDDEHPHAEGDAEAAEPSAA